MRPPADLLLPSPGARVLVTGACGGLGHAVSALLAQCGCLVAGLDVAAPATEFPGRVLLAADLADPDAAREAVVRAGDSLGGLDAVVGAAAIVDTIHRAARFPDDRWRRDIDANLSGQFYVLRAAYPRLTQSSDARVVLVSSMAGLDGLPGQAAYAASKGGVIGLGRALAAEWAGESIRVNTLVPGVFRTGKVDAMPPQTADRMRARVPLGRFGEQEELAGFIAFLLSAAGGYCHGGVYRVDGGMGLFTEGFFN